MRAALRFAVILLLATVASAQSADVVVTSNAPAQVMAGGDLTYFINVACAGPTPCGSVSYTWTTPPGAEFISLFTPALDPPMHLAPVQCTTPPSGSAGSVTCSTPAIVPLSTVAVTVIHLRAPLMAGSMTNSVVATSTNDPNHANDTSSATTIVSVDPTSADLAATLSGTAIVEEGGIASYALTLANNGIADASQAVMTFTPPSSSTIDAFSDGGLDCTHTSHPELLTCRASSAPAGWSASLNVNVRINAPASTTAIAALHVASDNGDPERANNDASMTTFVVAPATLGLTIEPGVVNAFPAQSFTFDVRATNDGTSPLLRVDVQDTVTSGIAFLAAQPSAGVCDVTPLSLHCQADSLAAGGVMTVQVTAIPPLSGHVTEVVTATAGSQAATAVLQVNVVPTSRKHAARH